MIWEYLWNCNLEDINNVHIVHLFLTEGVFELEFRRVLKDINVNSNHNEKV
jgi:hypothetical protein